MQSPSTDYYLGLEALSSRFCVGVLADAGANILAARRVQLPLSLSTLSQDTVHQHVLSLLKTVMGDAGLAVRDLRHAHVCLGMSGITFAHNAHIGARQIFDELPAFPRRLTCTPDVHIVFLSHVGGEAGSAIISGVGSMAFAASADAFRGGDGGHRVGGWGPALGDEGSGYWFGRAALAEIGRQSDARLPSSDSILWQEVRSLLTTRPPRIPALIGSLVHWDQLMANFDDDDDERHALCTLVHDTRLRDPNEWRLLASEMVSPLMRSAFELNDEAAVRIVKRGAVRLAESLASACDLAGLSSPADGPLVMYGGVLTSHDQFIDCVKTAINAHYWEREERSNTHKHDRWEFDIRTIGSPGAMRPACGALLLALGDSETGRLRLPPSEVVEKVREQIFPNGPEDLFND